MGRFPLIEPNVTQGEGPSSAYDERIKIAKSVRGGVKRSHNDPPTPMLDAAIDWLLAGRSIACAREMREGR